MALLSSSAAGVLFLSPSRTHHKEKSCKTDYTFFVRSKPTQFHTNCSFLGVTSSILSYRLKGNLQVNCCGKMSSMEKFESYQESKQVWLWTQSKEVMTASVERGWNTFIFPSSNRQLAKDWSSLALIHPLFIGDGELLDSENRRVATFSEVSSPQHLQQLQPVDELAENVVINLLDWQVIPAENIVAEFQGTKKTVFAVARTSSQAQTFLEALEKGLGGVVLRVEDVGAVLKLKDYCDRRNEVRNLLSLTKATVTRVQVAGMGDRVCVDLCSLLRPGEGILVGSFARGLFLVHSECLESNYIASRPFRVNAGPVHAYVAVPGEKTCYLSELQAGKEVLVVNQSGMQRTAIVGRIKIESRPLILVEAKKDSDEETTYSIILQNAETVGLVNPSHGLLSQQGINSLVLEYFTAVLVSYFLPVSLVTEEKSTVTAIPITSLKVGDEVMLRLQGGARHTGIEIDEFIVEK